MTWIIPSEGEWQEQTAREEKAVRWGKMQNQESGRWGGVSKGLLDAEQREKELKE